MPRAKVNFARKCPAGQECPIGLDAIDRNKAVYINGQFYDSNAICKMTKDERRDLQHAGYPLRAIQEYQRRVPHSRLPLAKKHVLAICYRAKDWAERKLYWGSIVHAIKMRLTYMKRSATVTFGIFAKPATGRKVKVGGVDVERIADGSYVVSVFDGKKRRTKTMMYAATVVKWVDDTFRGGRDFVYRPVLESTPM